MPLQIIKQLGIEEDIEWGIGTVVQPRDINGDGVPTDQTYNKVSTSSVPHLEGDGITLTDARTAINNRYTKTEADDKFALKFGDINNTFHVADPTELTHAVPKGYLEQYVADTLADYALRSEVLTKTNINAYTPTSDYHPATKKYVDDTVIAIGAGDMAKGIYDQNDNGIVDDSEKLGGLTSDEFMRYQGSSSDVDTALTIGYWDAANAVGAPTAEAGIITVRNAAGGLITQDYHVIGTDAIWYRSYDGVTWSAWSDTSSDIYIQDDLLGTNDPNAALGADQGRILAEQITQVSATVVPVGGIVMWAGTYSSIPSNWKLCNGANGTPDLRGRFIQGTTTEGDMKTTGGKTAATMPSHYHSQGAHTHTINHDHPVDYTSEAGSHTHTVSGGAYTLNTSGSGQYYSIQQQTSSSTTSTSGSHTHKYSVEDHIGSSGSAGGNNTDTAVGSGDNRPLYYTLAYIQRKS